MVVPQRPVVVAGADHVLAGRNTVQSICVAGGGQVHTLPQGRGVDILTVLHAQIQTNRDTLCQDGSSLDRCYIDLHYTYCSCSGANIQYELYRNGRSLSMAPHIEQGVRLEQ